MHYLDNAATTRVLPAAAQAALNAMETCFGNPSSLHSMGTQAARLLENSRATVAAALGGAPDEVIFAGSGTESTNIALHGVAHLNRHKAGHIITTALEHAATLQTLQELKNKGFTLTVLQPDASGHVGVDALLAALRTDTVLLSCQLVNNEIGTVLPALEFGKRLKAACPKALFHVDAVQGLFRIPLTPAKWSCDLMSVSGHKIGAPKGIGALYIKKGLRLPPLTFGGGQERGLRPGTEPLPLIAAFAKACEVRTAAFAQDFARVAALAAYLRERVADTLPLATFNGQSDVPHIVNFSVEGCKSEVMLRVLEQDEVYVSSGSACSKGKQSGVLTALGLPKSRTDTALRVSFCPENNKGDVDALLQAIQKGAQLLRRR